MQLFIRSLSFCTKGLLLPSDMPVTVALTPGICVDHFPPTTTNLAPTNNNALRPVPMYPYETYPSVGVSIFLFYVYFCGDKNKKYCIFSLIDIRELDPNERTSSCTSSYSQKHNIGK